MKIIIFTDIHGNFETLKLLSQTNDFIESDLRICLGDCIDNDMQNNEVLNFLHQTNTFCLLGNYEGKITDWFSEPYKNIEKNIQKNNELKQSLSKENYDFILNNFRKTIDINFNNEKFNFCHYKWENENSLCKRVEENLADITNLFKDENYNNTIYGHTHNFSLINKENKNYICVGALGYKCPAPYITVDMNITEKEFIKQNPNIKNFIYKNLNCINLKSITNITNIETKKLVIKDAYTINLNLIDYNFQSIINFYNTPKIQKRNFELSQSILQI